MFEIIVINLRFITQHSFGWDMQQTSGF